MKKLLSLAILSSVCLAKPCFGVDWIRDRIFTSSSVGYTGINYDVGYHFTDSTKFSVGPMLKPVFNLEKKELGVKLGLMAKLHYHHKFASTDVTPYITAGAGMVEVLSIKEDDAKGNLANIQKKTTFDSFFSYQLGAGVNLPLSSRTSVFAGYKMQKFEKLSHGVEFGMIFNL